LIIVNLVDLLTTADAARRLGVKPETLYAYVSRGLLRRHPAEHGRTSRFDAREVEALARRGRPRRSSRRAALDLVIATSITSIDRGRLAYRGHDVVGLAGTVPFESVAELIWTGRLDPSPTVADWPTIGEPDGHRTGRSAIATFTATLAALDPLPIPTTPDDVAAVGRALIGRLLGSLPVLGDGRAPRLHLADGTPRRGTIAGRLWPRLTAQRPPAGAAALLDTALTLLADHELAASALAVRVAASTRADPAAALVAGLATLGGPLHGRAGRWCVGLLDRAVETSSVSALDEAEQRWAVIPGFGHQLYPDGDPRARVLLDRLDQVWAGGRRLDVVHAIVAAARRRGREPNVDLALAAFARCAGISDGALEAVFALPRTAGWLAQAVEEYGELPLRFRPRADFRPAQ
jgi:citrate synthase